MEQLAEHINSTYLSKDVHSDGKLWVIFNHDGKDYQREVKFKPFSNFPIEYINFKGKQYQVNTVKSVLALG
ncbi:hypothetical protein EPabB_1 [Acinetobacter phage vB_AbaP_EPab_B]|nr:hypothetical protein EPabB_1 [Acinetobacter phage vB_AbaP_EPab_B]